MKKILCLTLAAVLLLLAGCTLLLESGTSEETSGQTTQAEVETYPPPATIAPAASAQPPIYQPNDPPAIMEPLQGGQMLYRFYSSKPYKWEEGEDEEYPVYLIGLVNQDGKLVKEPIYHLVEYYYDMNGRIIGVTAQRDRETTLYQLNGESRVLDCDGYRTDVCPGGHYAIVKTASHGTLHGYTASDPVKDGLYDIQANKYVIEPKDGQSINRMAGSVVMVRQYESNDTNGEQVSQKAYDYVKQTTTDFPLSMGHIQDYYPETGWYGGIWTQGEWQSRCYDSNLNQIHNMDDWSIDWDGFYGGEYLIAYNNDHYPDKHAWFSRSGNRVEKMYRMIKRMGNCYVAWDYDWNETGDKDLYNTDLNLLWTAAANEEFLEKDGLILLVGKNEVLFRVFDKNGKTLPDKERDAMRNERKAPDLKKFYPQPKDGSSEVGAQVVASCEEYLIIKAYWIYGSYYVDYETLAIDWDGNLINDCPIAPYFDSLGWFSNNAGDQGPEYYWVETKDKRGYIDVHGNWLFVDTTNT